MSWKGDDDAAGPAGSRTLERRAGPPEATALEPAHLIEEMVSWMGPLPPPSAMRAYEEVLPGACERMLALTERQAAHRQSIEREEARSAVVVEQRGQAIAALIGVLAIVCGTYLMATDHDGWGFATIVTAIAGLVGATVFSRGIGSRGDGASDAAEETLST